MMKLLSLRTPETIYFQGDMVEYLYWQETKALQSIFENVKVYVEDFIVILVEFANL